MVADFKSISDIRNQNNESLTKSESQLLQVLAKTEEDVESGKLTPMQDSFDELRSTLLEKKKRRNIET
mgnify:FL=1